MKLSTRYLLIIVLSIFIFPISYLGVNLVYYFALTGLNDQSSEIYHDPIETKKEWNEIVAGLSGKSNNEIINGLTKAENYQNAQVKWVNSDGILLFNTNKNDDTSWNVGKAIAFMQQADSSSYFTVTTSLIGSENEGFVILQIPLKYVGSQWDIVRDKYVIIWFGALAFIWSLVIFVSWLFFNKLRKRLVALQLNMEKEWEHGIPPQLMVKVNDEIGQLEHSFNKMAEQIRVSKQNEQQQTELRKQLITNLSHDIRTPLTVIRGHAFKLNQCSLSGEAEASAKAIQNKVDFLGVLIDNMASFTLLSSGMLPMNMTEVDVRKIVRSSMSEWYPIFEQKGFQIDIELDHSVIWRMDEVWFKRVLDNLLQNVMRHAQSGKYIAIKFVKTPQYVGLLIKDHGPGMEAISEWRGTGIGLSIISEMLTQMNIAYEWNSTPQGTEIIIYAKE